VERAQAAVGPSQASRSAWVPRSTTRSPLVGRPDRRRGPGPGDPDGSGTATLTVNPGLATICSAVTVSGIAPATAAHTHLGAVGVAGPIVVGLTPRPTAPQRLCGRSIEQQDCESGALPPKSWTVTFEIYRMAPKSLC